MDPSSSILAATVKTAVDLVARRLERNVHSTSPTASEAWKSENLADHLRWASGWSNNLQFFPLSSPEETLVSTHGLRFVEPRRLISPNKPKEVVSEEHILASKQHILISGGPGSGKTTTLKRICCRLLGEPGSGVGDDWDFPIVVRLRDIDGQTTLETAIARALGIRYQAEVVGQQKQRDYFVGQVRLHDLLVQLFEEMRVVILLDGLDEVSSPQQTAIFKALQELAYSLKSTKLIMTIRSGESIPLIESVQALEVAPLSHEEQRELADQWLGAGAGFMAELGRTPYYDLAQRPLFLTYLMVLFKRFGELPEQPSEVYERFVSLLLKDWDEQRGLSRRSKYAFFGPDRKLRFLAALAYHLTYELKAKVFNSKALREIYDSIRTDFGLPDNEADQVVAEIESHSGLVIAASRRSYEFAHLSLQEYLCAHHLVREPFPALLPAYLAEYPAPVAVAVAISSNPSDWFAGLVLREENCVQLASAGVRTLHERLGHEKVNFRPTTLLGLAILRLMGERRLEEEYALDFWRKILGERPLLTILGAALEYYVISAVEYSPNLNLERRIELVNAHGFITPALLCLSGELIVQLVKEEVCECIGRAKDGALRKLSVKDGNIVLLGSAGEEDWVFWHPGLRPAPVVSSTSYYQG